MGPENGPPSGRKEVADPFAQQKDVPTYTYNGRSVWKNVFKLGHAPNATRVIPPTEDGRRRNLTPDDPWLRFG